MLPIDYCKQKIRINKLNQNIILGLIPHTQKNALLAIYALYQELNDIAYQCSDYQVAQTTFAWWRQDIDKIFSQNKPEHPINQALQLLLPQHPLPQHELVEMVNGMEMNLNHLRYQSFSDLQYYCQRVFGTIAKLFTHVLGYSNNQSIEFSNKLGIATQLINIIRNIGQDARQGKILIPIDELAQFNVSAQTILNNAPPSEFANLINFQIKRIKNIYKQAFELLPREDIKKQTINLIIAHIYYMLLIEIEHDNPNNLLKYKIYIPQPRQFRIALKTRLFGFSVI